MIIPTQLTNSQVLTTYFTAYTIIIQINFIVSAMTRSKNDKTIRNVCVGDQINNVHQKPIVPIFNLFS